ncbi:MAG: molybdopterin oxidoreductase, partial [Caulobacteraceae bacterium]|nr:molybdopterin oxidoreductase [Caulobacteraceae bacterium]
ITQGRLPARDWLISLFEQEVLDGQDRIALLAGRPLGPVEDVGRMVCACLKIGEKTIQKAVAAGADSVEAVSVATLAGTNCGSCRVEIARLLKPTETRHAA